MTSTTKQSFLGFPNLRPPEMIFQTSGDHVIDPLLEDNNLIRKQSKKASSSLMEAVSDGLDLNLQSPDSIYLSLQDHLKDLLRNNRLTRRLEQLFNQYETLTQDYLLNPRLLSFEKISLELISSCFQVKVVLYCIVDNYLTATIINNGYEKSLRIFRDSKGAFFPLSPKPDLYRTIVLDIIENAMENVDQKISQQQLSEKAERGSVETSSTNDSPPSHQSFEKVSLSATSERNMSPHLPNFFQSVPSKADSIDLDSLIQSNFDFLKEEYAQSPLKPQEAQYTVKNYPGVSAVSSKQGSLLNVNSSKFVLDNTRNKNYSNSFTGNFGWNENEVPKKENLYQNFPQANDLGRSNYPQLFPPNQTNTQKERLNFADFSHHQQQRLPQKENLFSGGALAQRTPQMEEFWALGKDPLDLRANYLEGLRQGFPEQQKFEMNQNKAYLYSRVPETPPNQIEGLFMNEIGFHEHLQGVTREQRTSFQNQQPKMMEGRKWRHTGRLKFFDETKNYGFIVMDGDGSDIFVHFDDLAKAKIGKDLLRQTKEGRMLRLSFCCMQYYGKYSKSRKAIEIEFLE